MKKMKLKNSTEKVFKVVNALKENAKILLEKGNDTAFITELEASVQKLDELEKELITLKETLDTKKCVFKQEKKLTLKLVKNAKDVLKKEVSKKQKAEQKKQPLETEAKPDTEQKEEKQPKPEKQPKTEATEEKQNTKIAEEAEEPK